jgi:hypothetical protein
MIHSPACWSRASRNCSGRARSGGGRSREDVKAQNKLAPFDVVFCRQEPDAEIVFVFNSKARDTIGGWFPDIEWQRLDDWHLACVERKFSIEMATAATNAICKWDSANFAKAS